MLMLLDELEIEVTESTLDNEDAFGGRWGWFWHGPRHRPKGPFGSASEAVSDFAEWLAQQECPSPPSTDLVLAQTFLVTSGQFLHTAQAKTDDPLMAEIVTGACCYALELILKSYLLSRGRSDVWNRDNIGHDLAKAFREATFLGLPDDDARIPRFIRAAGDAYARHELLSLSQQCPRMVRDLDLLAALRALHREVERRLAV
jgi:hypothetical protein